KPRQRQRPRRHDRGREDRREGDGRTRMLQRCDPQSHDEAERKEQTEVFARFQDRLQQGQTRQKTTGAETIRERRNERGRNSMSIGARFEKMSQREQRLLLLLGALFGAALLVGVPY